jgi:ligand-binding sensor domain-containing protein/two-component sensor histidine kinase
VKHALRPSVHLLFVILVITTTAFTQAPSINFQRLSDDQILSNHRVNALTQDKYGVMWIGTNDGLNRFDGYTVDIYEHERGNKNSLPDNTVRCLFTDSRGTVWIGTANGLASYDYRSNSFHVFLYNSKDEKSLPGNSISAINEDANGILWIGTFSGLCSFDLKDKRFTRFLRDNHSNSISSNYVRDIEFAPDGSMWISTSKGLNRLDLSTMRFSSFFHDPNDSTTLSGNTLTKMAIDKNGGLWVSVNETTYLECFDTKTNRVRHFRHFTEKQSHISNNNPRDIFIDRSGRLWVGTQAEGLFLFSPGDETFYNYKADFLEPNKLQSNAVVDFYQDNSGMIWLATIAYVERFKPDESKFIFHRPKFLTTQGFASPVTMAIVEDPAHRLWIATTLGIAVLDRKTGSYTHYQRNQKDLHSFNSQGAQALCLDKRGNMWIGNMSGVYLFDPVQNNFRKFYAKRDTSRNMAFVYSIVSDKNGDLLIGGQAGLSIYKFERDSFQTLLKNVVRIIYEDRSGIIWMGTDGEGLIKYDRLTGKKEHFTSVHHDSSSLASNHVNSIVQDRKGEIWIGTPSGLCRFDERTRKFTTFSEKDGMSNTRVRQLLVDNKDRIWMCTNRGISMLNEGRTGFTNYDTGELMQLLPFNVAQPVTTHDGYFCYIGNSGFKMFHPDSLRKNDFLPPLVLKRIMIFDQPLKLDSAYADVRSLKLSYKQNFFSFEFSALNYDHPEKNQYAYQLIGFDKKVVHNGTNRIFSYTNVPHGTYTLKVTASNNDEVWNEAGYEMRIVITPPFWVTWWFRTIVIIAFLAAVFAFFKLRENRIKKEQARQTVINKQIAEIRMVALRGQMNPHFIFNSLNSIQHFISTREKEEALNYLSKFSKLIRKILENSRENTVSLNNEIQLLELYIQLEQLRFSNKFDYHIAIDERIDMENTLIPPLIIQPYIENAILHGLINKNDKGDLWLSLERNNGSLICKIEDNGIGRARSQEIEQGKVSRHKSLGIKVTEERIAGLSELLDYNMEVVIDDLFEIKQASEEAPQAAGTRVTISIPIKEEE